VEPGLKVQSHRLRDLSNQTSSDGLVASQRVDALSHVDERARSACSTRPASSPTRCAPPTRPRSAVSCRAPAPTGWPAPRPTPRSNRCISTTSCAAPLFWLPTPWSRAAAASCRKPWLTKPRMPAVLASFLAVSGTGWHGDRQGKALPDLRRASPGGLASVLFWALPGCRSEPLAVEFLRRSRQG
jgi:hypothetical protein